MITYIVTDYTSGIYQATGRYWDPDTDIVHTEAFFFRYRDSDEVRFPMIPQRMRDILSETIKHALGSRYKDESLTPDNPDLLAYDLVDQED